MSALRQPMLENLQLRGMSERTQECYLRAVRQLAQHYHKSPDLITEEEIRQRTTLNPAAHESLIRSAATPRQLQ